MSSRWCWFYRVILLLFIYLFFCYCKWWSVVTIRSVSQLIVRSYSRITSSVRKNQIRPVLFLFLFWFVSDNKYQRSCNSLLVTSCTVLLSPLKAFGYSRVDRKIYWLSCRTRCYQWYGQFVTIKSTKKQYL